MWARIDYIVELIERDNHMIVQPLSDEEGMNMVTEVGSLYVYFKARLGSKK